MAPAFGGGVVELIYVFFAFLVAIYTGNYAAETWRSGNRFGSVVLFVLAILSFVLPAWVFLKR